MTFIRNLLSAFNLGHASLVGSSALAQIFPLLSAPIIARLYAPDDFGIYAMFFALSTILSYVSALALTHATLLEAEDEGAAHATLLALAVTAIFCALLLIVVFGTPRAILVAIFGEAVVPYLPWLPLSVLLSGVFTCLYQWTIRGGMFYLLARNKIVLGVSTAGLQLCVGLMHPGPIGFIVANLCGYGLAVLLLSTHFLKDLKRLRPQFSLRSGVEQFKKHHDLPLWQLPASLVNITCSYLPDLLIGRLFGVSQLGYFSLASRMVNFPISFIATSAQDIFRKQANDELIAQGHCRNTFNRFFILMVIVAVALLVPIILVAPYVFPFVFGSQWKPSGFLVQAFGLLVIVRFVTSPLSYVWIMRGHQKLDFLWQTGLLAISLATFLGPHLLKPDVSLYEVLWIYSMGVGAWYAFCLFLSYRLAYRESGDAPRPASLN
jgi:O-antigen/teichoic acid export membrane protein